MGEGDGERRPREWRNGEGGRGGNKRKCHVKLGHSIPSIIGIIQYNHSCADPFQYRDLTRRYATMAVWQHGSMTYVYILSTPAMS